MKVAFTGKGGVGKTTLASLFIHVLSKDGKEVLAADCDPDSNLARSLGFRDADKITPIAHMKDLINERMGVQEGNKTFYKLNPKIDDIPSKFSRDRGNIKLIVMGAVKEAGSGCMCPENAFIKNLLNHLILKKGEHLVMDMEAGVEHIGRATAGSCDFVLTVVEPSINSVKTAKNISSHAKGLGMKKIYAVGNKIRRKKDKEFIKKELGSLKLIESIDYDESFLDFDKEKSIENVSEKVSSTMNNIKKFLEEDLT